MSLDNLHGASGGFALGVDMEPLAYRYEDVAKILQITYRAVVWYVESGYLQAVGTGVGRRITRQSIREWQMLTASQPLTGTPEGHIYLIRFKQYYKIGLSRNARRRIYTLGTELPEPVEVVHLIPTNDMRRAEQMLHTMFAKRRANGEWFRLSRKEVSVIRSCQGLLFT